MMTTSVSDFTVMGRQTQVFRLREYMNKKNTGMALILILIKALIDLSVDLLKVIELYA
jgi:hypothetical protein